MKLVVMTTNRKNLLTSGRDPVRAVWHGFKKPRFFKKPKKPKKSEFRFFRFLKNKNLMSDLSF